MAPLGRRLIRGSALTLGSTLLTRALGAVQSIVIARTLDARHVGLFAIVTYVLGLVAAFADLGLPTATARLIAGYQGEQIRERRGVIATVGLGMLALATLAGCLVFASADLLADLYREASLAGLFRLAAVLLALSLIGAFVGGALQGLQRIGTLAAVGVFKSVATVTGILLLVPAFGLAGILLASIATEVLALVAAARPIARETGDGAATPTWAVARESLHLATPIFLNGLLAWGTALFVRSWLAGTHDYEHVGYYQLADALSRVVLLVASAVTMPLVPLIAELSATDPARMSDMSRVAMRVTLLGTLVPAIFLALGAPGVVVLAYGAAYAAAGPPTTLLAAAALLQGLGFVVLATLIGAGRFWVSFAVQAIGHGTVMALTSALAPAYGVVGVALAHLAAAAISLLAGVWSIRAMLGVTFDGSGRLVALAAGAWIATAVAVLAGVTGLGPAVALAAIVAALAWPTLRPEESAWIRRALGR